MLTYLQDYLNNKSGTHTHKSSMSPIICKFFTIAIQKQEKKIKTWIAIFNNLLIMGYCNGLYLHVCLCCPVVVVSITLRSYKQISTSQSTQKTLLGTIRLETDCSIGICPFIKDVFWEFHTQYTSIIYK